MTRADQARVSLFKESVCEAGPGETLVATQASRSRLLHSPTIDPHMAMLSSRE
ncbi:MAG: hypothetical protein ACOYEP_08745 [Limnochordia bacterium]|jgi:hypothetical protein